MRVGIAKNLKTFMAIDVGSNAIRMAHSDSKGKIITREREPISLGEDVFSEGRISDFNLDRTVSAFKKFRQIAEDASMPCTIKAVATAAIREASNQLKVAKEISHHSGIDLNVIDGLKEAQLVHKAIVKEHVKVPETFTIIDIGGGSAELLLIEHHEVKEIKSFPLGTIRLNIAYKKNDWSISDFRNYIRDTIRDCIDHMLTLVDHVPQVCFGTGGNPKALAKIAKNYYNNSHNIPKELLGDMVSDFLSMRRAHRQQKYDLNKNRAKVILPASIVIQEIMWMTKANTFNVPMVGLIDGVLAEMIE